MKNRTPAQLYALIVGATLTVAGIIGFLYSTAFGTPGETHAVFGILDVNGWHNVVHLVTGVIGLASLGYVASRTYALGLGLVYLVVTVWGVVIGNHHAILSIVPINTEDDVLHALLALAGLAAYAATRQRRGETAVPRTA